jgi:hypothetical protein
LPDKKSKRDHRPFFIPPSTMSACAVIAVDDEHQCAVVTEWNTSNNNDEVLGAPPVRCQIAVSPGETLAQTVVAAKETATVVRDHPNRTMTWTLASAATNDPFFFLVVRHGVSVHVFVEQTGTQITVGVSPKYDEEGTACLSLGFSTVDRAKEVADAIVKMLVKKPRHGVSVSLYQTE